VDETKHAARVLPNEVTPKAEQELDELRVVPEVGRERSNDAVVIGPERARVAGTGLVTTRRVLEMTVEYFHARSLTRAARPAIGACAASRCG
jgi:hypothetical protein